MVPHNLSYKPVFKGIEPYHMPLCACCYSDLPLYSINKPMTSQVFHPKPIPILEFADGKNFKMDISGLGLANSSNNDLKQELYFCYIKV